MSVLGQPRQRRSLGGMLGALGARIEDGALIRSAFFAMLFGTGTVLYLDYKQLIEVDIPTFARPGEPILPAVDPNAPTPAPGPEVTIDRALLDAPLTVALKGGGVLELTGTLDMGASARVEAEVEAHGEYIKTVALNSPGGSVSDALAIGTLFRKQGYTTSVAAGALCASSCPLVLAGGKERLASAKAAIGVHQIYALATAGGPTLSGVRAAGLAMSDAQKTTAVISRYLGEMGVEPELWLHALETPPDRLYYLSAGEMTSLKLVTNLAE